MSEMMPTNPQSSNQTLSRSKTQMVFPRRRKAMLLFALAGLVAGLPARGDLSIAPAFVEVALGKGPSTGSFHISNLADKDERFRMNVLYFVYASDGTFAPKPTGEYSLADWIKLNPRELDIAAKSERTVRFAIMPPKGVQPGEYWAGIELESLRRSKAEAVTDAGTSMGVELVTSVIVPVFGRAGKLNYSGTLGSLALVAERDGAPAIQVLVANSGTGRFLAQGDYTLVDASGATAATGLFGKGHVYRANERLFSKRLDSDIPAGSYTAKIKFTAPELDEPLEITAPVTWKATGRGGR
jgi:hypothetical protein